MVSNTLLLCLVRDRGRYATFLNGDLMMLLALLFRLHA